MPEFSTIPLAEVPDLDRSTNGGHRWSGADRELVRQWYGKVPKEKLAERIGASQKAVSLVASYLGVGTRPRSANHSWTEEEDCEVRRGYDGTRRSGEVLARNLGLTYDQVKGRVQALGVARVTHRAWTPAEDAQLAALLDKGRTCVAIGRILGRSENSIKIRAQRHHRFRFGVRNGWYTKKDACEILGVDHRWLQARIDNGALKAKPHFEGDAPQKNGQHPWHIEEEDLAEFIRTYPQELQGRNVDLVAIVDLLAGLKRAPLDYLSPESVAHYRGLGWSDRQIGRHYGVSNHTVKRLTE